MSRVVIGGTIGCRKSAMMDGLFGDGSPWVYVVFSEDNGRRWLLEICARTTLDHSIENVAPR